MNLSLLWLPAALCLLDWLAVYRDWKGIQWITKPGVVLGILIWIGPGSRSLLTPFNWFTLGILCSLLGDVILLLPHDRFIARLFAFLGAHLAYIIGLNLDPLPFNFSTLMLFAVVLAVSWRLSRRFATEIRKKQPANLLPPFAIYFIVLSIFLFSALATLAKDTWQPWPSLLVTAGALLFFISDVVLAWHRFLMPIPQRDIKVRIPYHLAQLALIAGASLHFLA